MARLPPLTSQLVTKVLAGAAGLGMIAGVVANQFFAMWLALPDSAGLPEFEDASPAMAEGASTDNPSSPFPRPSAAGRKGGGDKRSYVEAIVDRNVFDSAAIRSIVEGPQEVGCKDSRMGLYATVVAEEPAYSSALIGSGKGRALGYKIGDELSGEGRIATIEQKKVCMEGGGCLCMGEEKKRTPLAEAAGAGAATDEGGVTKVSDTKYLVDKSFVEKQLANVEALATQIRAVPKTENGSIVGFRLSAIRKGSPFDKLGIKNGDILHSTNGQALSSTEAALAAYQALGSENSFNFEITRKNQKMTIEYEVR
jgi:general secretion pathway protein C